MFTTTLDLLIEYVLEYRYSIIVFVLFSLYKLKGGSHGETESNGNPR